MAFDQYRISFYGTWRLRTGVVDESHNAQNAFTITGSDDHDGTYYPRATDPALTMTVTGSAWRLEFAQRNYGLLIWVEVAAQRLTTFDPADGVGVELDNSATVQHRSRHAARHADVRDVVGSVDSCASLGTVRLHRSGTALAAADFRFDVGWGRPAARRTPRASRVRRRRRGRGRSAATSAPAPASGLGDRPRLGRPAAVTAGTPR